MSDLTTPGAGCTRKRTTEVPSGDYLKWVESKNLTALRKFSITVFKPSIQGLNALNTLNRRHVMLREIGENSACSYSGSKERNVAVECRFVGE